MYKKFLNIIFPSTCGFCGQITKSYNFICEDCYKEILIDMPYCKLCGSLLYSDKKVCAKCEATKKYYNKLIFFDEYEGILKKKMIEYKFNNKKYLADFFAELLALKITTQIADFITAVPISRERMRERGYNQADLIASRLSNLLKVQYKKNLLLKKDGALRQSELTKSARKKNIKNVFYTKEKNILNKNVLLIDDILTTGATANECSKILKQIGAKDVTIGVVLLKK